MGIISLASGNSCWRGLDYYKNKKITELNKINENEYESVVKGKKINVLTRDILLKNINSIIIFQNGEATINFK